MNVVTIRVVMLVCALAGLAACGSSDGQGNPLEFVGATTVATPGPAPLARSLTVATTVPTTLSVTVEDNSGHQLTFEYPGLRTNHAVNILGLRAGRLYAGGLTLTDERGRTIDQPLPPITTDPLPAGFPVITLLGSDPAEMEAGLTLLETHRRDRTTGYLVVVDSDGEVVWYLETDGLQAVTRLGDDGLLLSMTAGDNMIQKLDFLGNTIVDWHAAGSGSGSGTSIPIDGADFHHDVFELPGGTILTSTRESIRTVDNFPIDENDVNVTATVTIREEPVIEFDTDGQIVGKWDFLDILKPTRIAFDGALGQPDATDWVHLNSIWYEESDDTIITSLRHQDAVVKFSRATGDLIWILSPPDNWQGFESFLLQPTNSPFGWSYHQHAATVTPNGTLLLFDNGNNKASPFTGQVPVPAAANHSRAVEYRIDEQTMTIEQVWEYGVNQSGEAIYTPFIGDADWLPTTENILITFGGICELNGMPSDDIRNCRVTGRVIEVTRDTFDKVFEIQIDDEDPMSLGYRTYRSERIPNLYPLGDAVVTVQP
ncbi:MAG: aryl-sulfate sulfotransferase [Pseudomonadota bacterium]